MPETNAALVDATLSHRRWVGRALRVPVSTGTFGGVVSIAVQLVACLALGWLLGGTGEFTPHWYYLPVILAGLRFGVRGAFLTALAAGILAGPLTALDIDQGIAQPVGRQVTQAVAFIVVGVGFALIFERTMDLARRELSGHELGERVTAAIERGDVAVEYQPIWTSRPDGEHIVGAEALVRWVDADLGTVPPGTFVPVLEEADRLDELGLWVLDEACRRLALWQGSDAGGDTPFHVAVNVSIVQLDDEFPDLVLAALDRHGCDPAGLVLELTERTLLEDRATALPRLSRIRETGVRIAIDDFGTGYSSLAYLRDLDFDILKLDRAFIDSLGSTRPDRDATDSAIVGAVITLARQLDKEVVVEGIESRAQLDRLRALGPVNVQGSLLSPPISAEALTERLQGGHDRPSTAPTTLPRPGSRGAARSRAARWLHRELALDSTGEDGAHSHPAQVILAGMFLAGSLITIAVVLFSDGQSEATLLALGSSALPCALFLHHFRRRISERMLHALLLVGTVIIVAATATDPVPTTMVASSAFLIWVTIYASAFFDLRGAVAHGVLAGVAFGLVLHLHPVEQDAAVWIIIMGTAGVAGFVVGWFARRLRSLAATDILTGLPNRQAFESTLTNEIARAERANTPLAVALVDLDNFKAINDSEGHQAGDRVLAELPGRWCRELRAHDVLARYGGDEFVVLLPNCPLDDAEDALDRMSRAGHPTCSVGVATLAWGENPEMLLARADAALYRAKSQRASVCSDRSVPTDQAVGGSYRPAHPAGSARE
jgi:diguanylate cyclase (GGDEF)-like protein